MNEIGALGVPGRLSSSLLHPLIKQALINNQLGWLFDLDLQASRMVRNASIVSINYMAEMDQSELGFFPLQF